jgi:hypothetical protein
MSSELPHENTCHIFAKTSTETSTNSSNKGFLSPNHLKWAFGFLLAYFGIRLVYLALNVSSLVPPDEVTHAGLCRIFASVFLLPDNSPQTYEFGLVTNIPWLYYWTMGKLLHLNIFGLTDLVFLRLLNIPLAFGTVFFVRRTLLLLSDDRITQLLLVIVMTNTAMFSLLSASVSYDNLTNLLAAMAIYYLFAFFKNRSGGLLAASILCQLAGCLTKVTFLPLVLVLGLLLLVYELKDLRSLPAAVTNHFRTANRRAWLSALAILVALGLNLHLYGGNYLNYGTLNPGMAEVSPKNAMQYRIAARETIFRLYTQEKISYMEALMMAGDIQQPGDKADMFAMLMNYENLKRNPKLWMGPLPYTEIWFENMVGTIFGIKGHLQIFKDSRYIIPIYLVMTLSLLGFAVRWRPRQSGWLPPSLAAVACCYAGYILYKINYNAYLYYGTPGVTLQGRYLFPVIGPLYVLLCHYLLQLFRSDKIRLALALATALLFIAYDFPWFLMHTTPQWYEWMPR